MNEPPESTHLRVRRNIGMQAAWATCALVCFGFALTPWIIAARNGGLPSAIAVFLTLAWSAFPAALGLYLLFHALCRVDLLGGPGSVRRRASLFFLQSTKDFRIDRAYLVRRWYHSRHRVVSRDVVFVRSEARKRLLVDELTCADLPGVLQWIADVAKVKILDTRDRKPLGRP